MSLYKVLKLARKLELKLLASKEKETICKECKDPHCCMNYNSTHIKNDVNDASCIGRKHSPVGTPRQRAFCARHCGMKKKLTSKEVADDPESCINKGLRRWKCRCG